MGCDITGDSIVNYLGELCELQRSELLKEFRHPFVWLPVAAAHQGTSQESKWLH